MIVSFNNIHVNIMGLPDKKKKSWEPDDEDDDQDVISPEIKEYFQSERHRLLLLDHKDIVAINAAIERVEDEKTGEVALRDATHLRLRGGMIMAVKEPTAVVAMALAYCERNEKDDSRRGGFWDTPIDVAAFSRHLEGTDDYRISA